MKYGITCVLACLFSLPAIADDKDWVYIGGGNISQVYLQSSSIETHINSGNVKAWTKSVLPDGGHVLGKHDYACAKNEHLKLESHKYDASNNYLSGGKAKPVWYSIIPESVGGLLMKAVCTTAAKQELDKIELVEGGYTSEAKYALIRSSFGKYVDAVVMDNIQQSMDNMEW